MLKVFPLISNRELSVSPVPLTREYVGLWLLVRYWFCADIVLTVVVPLVTMLLSSTIYHGPRFCLNWLAPTNMEAMLVTLDTFQFDMSLLN